MPLLGIVRLQRDARIRNARKYHLLMKVLREWRREDCSALTCQISLESVIAKNNDPSISQSKAKIKLKKAEPPIATHGNDEYSSLHQKNIKRAIFATKAGAAANLFMASTKGVVGLMVSSTALIAGIVSVIYTEQLKSFFLVNQMLRIASGICFAMLWFITLSPRRGRWPLRTGRGEEARLSH